MSECDHEVLKLVESGIWVDTQYSDKYVCEDCDSVFYQDFTPSGWTDDNGDSFDLDGRELR